MKRFNRKLGNNSGFTLVEVIIAMLILSLIASAALLAFMFSVDNVKNNQYEMKALNLANERIESVRSMSFADIGTKNVSGPTTIYGDPKGEILQSETKIVDKVKYLIKTTISWEDENGWELNSTDWDYKSVRVEVVPQVPGKEDKLTQVVNTYVTRDSGQPLLTGANMAFRFVRGWNGGAAAIIPVANVKISLVSGPDTPRQIMTSSSGIARFINLTPGTHTAKVDPSTTGMMLHPQVSENWVATIAGGSTKAKEFQVEYPCYLNITMKSLEGDPITLPSGKTGNIKVDVPFGTDIDKTFGATDVSSTGGLPQSICGALWPVGTGYSGVYSISSITIDKSTYFGAYDASGSVEALWNGTFDAPGTTKNITCYFGVLPKTPSGVGTNWAMTSGELETSATPYSATHAIFATSDRRNSLIMPTGKTSNFNADDLYFENTGSASNIGLIIRDNSSIGLHAAKIIFRGVINIESNDATNQGKIVLKNVFSNGTNAYQIPGSSIGGLAYPLKMYGKVYFTEPLNVDGTKVINPGGYYFYDGLVLPDNASELIPITKDNYVG